MSMIINVSFRNSVADDEPSNPRLMISDSVEQLAQLRMKEHAFRRLFGSAAIQVSGRLPNALDPAPNDPPLEVYRMQAWVGNDRLLVTPVGVGNKPSLVVALPDGKTVFFDMMQARPDEPTELPSWADAALCGSCGALMLRKPAEDWTCRICGHEAKS